MICSVVFLDSSVREWNLPNNATGQELYDEVWEHLNLLERDYFGLAIFHSPSTKTWLDVSKQINKQLKGVHARFVFSVKFYPPNPAQLCEDLTRYLLCLQLRQDLLSGRLPCPSVTLTALGSYVLQSEFGPYDPHLHGDAYTNSLYLAPNQNEELLKRMRQQHLANGSMSPAQADSLFLQNACQLPMYGVDRHPAKDSDGEDVVLGVCSEGIVMYRDDMVESRFLWPRVLKLSYKHSRFLLRTVTSEGFFWTLCFMLPSNRACKSLWKVSVEHHSFFRLQSVDPPRRRLLSLRSQFCYRGHTEAQCLQEYPKVSRPNPPLSRKPRAKSTSLDALTRVSPSEPDDWFLALDTTPPKPLYIPGSDEGPVLAGEWKLEDDDWFLYFDQPRTSLMPLGVPLSDMYPSQDELEQDVEGHGTPAGGVEGETKGESMEELILVGGVEGEARAESLEELVEEEEYMEEVDVKETQEHGEVMEMTRVRRVKIVRKTTREVKSVEGMLTESKDFDIFEEEQAEREIHKAGVMTERLTDSGITDQTVKRINQTWKDAERDDWYILFDRQPHLFYAAPAAKQWRMLDQQTELLAGIIKEAGEELEISRQTRQDWEVVEEFSEKATEEGVKMGQAVEIRQQTRRTVKIQMQDVKIEGEELSITEDIVQEMQEQIDVIQEKLQELVEVEERQVQLDMLKGKLQEVDLLQYQVQTMEQLKEEEPQEDDWHILLERLPYIIYPTPLAGDSRAYTVESSYEPDEESILEEGRSEQIVTTEQRVEAPDEHEDISEYIISHQMTTPVFPYIEDDWFVLFDQLPLQAKTPLPVMWENSERPADVSTVPLEMPAEEESEAEMTEERIERQMTEERIERQMTEERIERQMTKERIEGQEQVVAEMRDVQPAVQELRPTFTAEEGEDDWHIPLEVNVIEPYTEATKREVEVYQLDEQTRFESTTVITRVATTRVAITEERKEKNVSIMEERSISAETHGDYIPTQVKRTVAVRDIEDDWFILLEPAPVELKPAPTVISERGQTSRAAEEHRGGERIVRVEERTERQKQVMVEVKDVVQPVVQAERAKLAEKSEEDDWYIHLEPPKERVWVSPQYEAETVMRVETVKRVKIAEEEAIIIPETQAFVQRPPVVMRNPAVVPRDIEDDWFLLFAPLPVEVQSQPTVVTWQKVKAPTDVFRVTPEPRAEREEERRRAEDVGKRQEREMEMKEVQPSIQLQRPSFTPREVEDDWYILMDVPSKETAEVKAAPKKVVRWERTITEQETRVEEKKVVLERPTEPFQPFHPQRQPQPVAVRDVDDDWFMLLDPVPLQDRSVPSAEIRPAVVSRPAEKPRAVERERIEKERLLERERMREEEMRKRVIIVDAQKAPVVRHITDDWFTLLDRVPVEARAPPRAETRPAEKTKTVERERIDRGRITKRERMEEEEMRKKVTIAAAKKAPVVRHITDDWFILLDRVPVEARAPPRETRLAVVSRPAEKPKAVDKERIERGRITETERMKREEEMRKRLIMAGSKRAPAARHITDDWYILLDRVAVEPLPKVAPIIPPTPARPVPVDRPMTSTPTVHPAPIVKYIPKEERIEERKKVELKVKDDEELTIIKRKTRKIEGENIYIRHSVLMLEDFDVTQEVVLRHHASISELKRLFMEAEPEPYPSEWDRHLSICHLDSHTQLISMDEWEIEGRISIM
ncbi:hypothetical protein ACEWY4_019469 [Coilia grayii]|uniref:Protein 4.1 n=1 Tax=Coilia grayii TaxID=363190 RepID=A0ABD1J9U1_9TELE